MKWKDVGNEMMWQVCMCVSVCARATACVCHLKWKGVGNEVMWRKLQV